MKPAKTINPQEWMTAPETASVMAALEANNRKALFVGGCVRNMLMGRAVEDIDIATVWTPEESTARLEKAGIKVVPTGITHGTVTAVINKKHFEITTLRRDVETDGRRAVVAFTDDWREDAQRRDFTINTLLADAEGNIYDPTGKGLEDLAKHRVVFVGDAETRIKEDYLRILRFFRFHAVYSEGKPDAVGLAACRKFADKIPGLSRERITQEFFKILSIDDPTDILSVMFDNGVLDDFRFPAYSPDFFSHVCGFQNRYGLAFIAARLFVLAALDKGNVEAMEKLLLIPKVFKKDIEAVAGILGLPDMNTGHAVRVAVYKHGRTAAAQTLMIALAQDKVMNGYAPEALTIIQKWDIPDFPVSGEDLMAAGIKPGPSMGEKLRAIEEWWIEQDFRPGKGECLAYRL